MNTYMGRELELLVQSMICGALLVLVYDGIRIFRIIGKRVKSLDTAVDILFWSAAGLFLFFMCLRENGGSVRCYLLCGILLGAGVWYWGIGHFYREFAFILAKRLHFCLQRVTIFLLVKMRKFCLKIRKGPGIDKSKGAWNEKKEKCCARKKRRSTKVQNRVAMISISMVVCMLVVLLAFKEHSLQVKYQTNENRKAQLQEEITTEEARTKDIEDMQEYMQSDEYAEKIAKEKIGLVKDNEIIFKENK